MHNLLQTDEQGGLESVLDFSGLIGETAAGKASRLLSAN